MKIRRRIAGTPEPMHFWRGFGDVRIAGDSWGDPAAPLVVLLHGGGQTRHAWKRIGEELGAAGYYAVAFDARGHGDSDWVDDGDYSQDAMLEDLRCVIGQLGKTHAALVGASMGGETSLIAAGERRLHASAVILVDTAPKVEIEGVQKIGAFMLQKRDGFDSLEEVADAIANYQPHRTRPKDLGGLAKNVRLGANGKYYWHWDPQFLIGLEKTFDLVKRQQRLETCASRVEIPTLLVRGGMSDVVSEEGAREFLRLYPKSQYVNITKASHMVAGDRNDIFGAAIIEFLSREVPPSPADR
ncbi:alpha/beta hydrolase [Noviherbaspirillum saxi]|uniref:Alpha/beta hydrolase n=2 Tax=Noviherbaspirillum saxi TaxID=2320863 RepID=A0A3A3FV23_9BURK|nr:alpha/beta hydrolase [Noviherbaspirillum saxi]RJG00048.1 alpha/beta hydrolase [Noviherbaspirillum saxi]